MPYFVPPAETEPPALDKVVDTLVSDAIRIVENTPISPPPWVSEMRSPRERPSQELHRRYDEYVFPTPHWGLNINLASTYMGILQASRIANLMITSTTITTLDLSMCDLYSEGCEMLMKCLQRNCVLRNLSLNGNRIGPRGAVAIAEYLQTDHRVERRRKALPACAPVCIAPLGFACGDEILPSYIPPHQGFNSTMSTSSMMMNNPPGSSSFESRSMMGNASVLLNNTTSIPNGTLRKGGGSQLNDGSSAVVMIEGVAVPVDQLSTRVPKPVEVQRGLYRKLNESQTDDDLAIAPPSYLVCPLESLSLSYNAIGDEGAIAIMNALRHNTKLEFINLRGNRLTNLGGFAILDALADHYTLEEDLKQKALGDKESLKLAKKGGKKSVAKAKKPSSAASTASRPSIGKPMSLPSRVIRSCLPDHLRFDMDNLASELREREIAAAREKKSTKSPPMTPIANEGAASDHSAQRDLRGKGKNEGGKESPAAPLLFESLMALVTCTAVPPLITSTVNDSSADDNTNTNTKNNNAGKDKGAFGAIVESLTTPKGKAKKGSAAASSTVLNGEEAANADKTEAAAQMGGDAQPSKTVEAAPREPQAVRWRKRWATLTAEQRHEFLAFNFPSLYPQQVKRASGGGKGVHQHAFAPNPILDEAARILFDGNTTLSLSLLNSELFSAKGDSSKGDWSPERGDRGGVDGGATTVFPPIKKGNGLYTHTQHRAPNAIENAGGYYYPAIVPCEGREATLFSPAMLAAPEEDVYFYAPDGRPFTISFSKRSHALKAPETFTKAATIIAATAMQFLQSTLVKALHFNINAASSSGYVPPGGFFSADPSAVIELAKDGTTEHLGQVAAKTATDDYHVESAAVAMLSRRDRKVGDVHAVLADKLADFDPFSKEAETTEEKDQSSFYRYSDHIPLLPQPPNPSNTLPKSLQPAAPPSPLTPSQIRRPVRPLVKAATPRPNMSRCETSRLETPPPEDAANANGDSQAAHPLTATMSISMESLAQHGGGGSTSPLPNSAMLTFGQQPPATAPAPPPSLSVISVPANAVVPTAIPIRKRIGSAAAVETVVPSALSKIGADPSSPPALKKALLPPELLFLEVMGYFGGGAHLHALLSQAAERQREEREMGGGLYVNAFAREWRVTNTMAPHCPPDSYAASGISVSGVPEPNMSSLTRDVGFPVIPPFGQLYVPTFCFAAGFPDYRNLIEYRSAAMSPSGDSDDGDSDSSEGARRRRQQGDSDIVRQGGLGSSQIALKRPLLGSALPLSVLSERLAAIAGKEGISGNGGGREALRSDATMDNAVFDRIVSNARKAYDSWTNESSAITAALEVQANSTAAHPTIVPVWLGSSVVDARRARGTPVIPSPPPTATTAPSERRGFSTAPPHDAASSGSVSSRYAYGGGTVVTSLESSALSKPFRPSPKGSVNKMATSVAARAPHLPPRLPLLGVSLEMLTHAALTTTFGSLPVAQVVLRWSGGRKDVREYTPDVYASVQAEMKTLMVAPETAKKTAQTTQQVKVSDSPPSSASPAARLSLLKLPLPMEVSPYLPLASTVLDMARSPMYALVDPLTAFLRGRERRLSAEERARFDRRSVASFPVALSAVNTAESIALAIALSHRDLNEKSERGVPPTPATVSRASPLGGKGAGHQPSVTGSKSFGHSGAGGASGFGRAMSTDLNPKTMASGSMDRDEVSFDEVGGRPSVSPPLDSLSRKAPTEQMIQKEMVRIVNEVSSEVVPAAAAQPTACGIVRVTRRTLEKVFESVPANDTAEKGAAPAAEAAGEANAPPYPNPLTLDRLTEIATWECEAAANAWEGAPIEPLSTTDATISSLSSPLSPRKEGASPREVRNLDEESSPFNGPAPIVGVARNSSITSVWFENNAIDPLLCKAITMAFQLRYKSPEPAGFNKKVLKQVLLVREEEELKKMNPR